VAEAGDKAFWNVVITLVPFLILWDNRSPPGFSGVTMNHFWSQRDIWESLGAQL
jgi:hypothetical protein